jgi:anti-sigma B factor antagonist
MKIEPTRDNSTLTLALEGRLDTLTAPELEQFVNTNLEGVSALIFDFANLEYVSSAGLRVLLSTQKKMGKQGSMKVKSVRSEIMEVLDITGFSDILTII